mmetsp:Transcript_46937/g.133930  ORF Transcript_46937/g.133930 Transcript_46937/m.133930 type:complete len:88 (+) Transcript_46937:343-606(+)
MLSTSLGCCLQNLRMGLLPRLPQQLFQPELAQRQLRASLAQSEQQLRLVENLWLEPMPWHISVAVAAVAATAAHCRCALAETTPSPP